MRKGIFSAGKKGACLLCALALCLCAPALGEGDAPAEALLQRAMTAAMDMGEWAAYARVFTGGEDLLAQADAIAQGDFSAPKAVALYRVAPEAVVTMLEGEGFSGLTPGDRMFTLAQDRLFAVPVAQMAALEGAEWLAMANILAVGEGFLPQNEGTGLAYLLLDYGPEQPAVAAAFCLSAPVARMSAMFLPAGDWGETCARFQEALSMFGNGPVAPEQTWDFAAK